MRIFPSLLSATALLALTAPLLAQSNIRPGTDVSLGILGSIDDVGRVGSYPNGVQAVAMATTSCNYGTVNVPWLAAMQEDHPLIAFLVAREVDGRLMQISDRSYLKHGFYALSDSQCTPCRNPSNGSFLGVGCSDTYGIGNNGDNYWLGPPSEIDPWLGTWSARCSFFDLGLTGTNCDGNRSFTQTQARMADDLGFSDLGCYGSEIQTPNLDRLARHGVRFTQFYNTAKCHSSRVSLLSGRWCRQAGDESLRRAVTIPEILGPTGYFTAMTGKWHLDKQPTDFGFQRYFGHLSGACSYYQGDNTFRFNGQPWSVPDKGFYTTIANVDYAMQFLEEARAENQPWFLYLAFNAPHAPLQPLESDYKKYLGQYDVGWDVVRTARLNKQRELRLFGGDIEPSPRPEHIPAWDSLSTEQQRWESQRMSAYAGLIDRVDQELGRLFDDLRQRGEFDNTLVLFFSDNGACPYDRRSTGADQEPFDPDTRWSDSTGWAWARNSPFRYYKQNQFEGGIASPAIAHWPAGLKLPAGSLVHSPAHLVDILPTLAEITGSHVPEQWADRDPTPLAGVSLKPILDGKPMSSRPPIHLLFSSDRGLRDGDWKLVSFQSQPWELYNLASDRTELHDLASTNPEIVARMVKQWHEMTADVLHAPAKEQAPVATIATEHRHREWTNYASPSGSEDASRAAKQNKKSKRSKKSAAGTGDQDRSLPRARVGTQLSVEDQQLVLTCSGKDPGLAFDHLTKLDTSGPYRLVFEIQSMASGPGDLYFTVDAHTILPKGFHQTFEVIHDGQWHSQLLKLDTAEALHAFRLDPAASPGLVRLRELKLQDASGKTLQAWP